MSHIFCYSCGVKIEYNFAKPNFCSKCGASFGGAQESQATVEQVPNQAKASVV